MKKQHSSCLGGCLLAFFCLCMIIGVVSFVTVQRITISPGSFSIELKNLSILNLTPVPTSILLESTAAVTTPRISPTVNPSNPIPLDPVAAETYQILRETVVPNSDNQDLAWRFKGIAQLSLPNTDPPPVYEVGDRQTFYASNDDSNQNFRVQATLKYVTPHLYFWIENGISYDSGDLKTLAIKFENNIYPTDRKIFGSEWTPGIDNDVHLFVLYARNLGDLVAGYFSSADETPPELDPYSNAHEMFYINSTESLDREYIYGVMAHEFQHMIHWYQDSNEEEWVNEGLSDLAIYLNGFDPGGFDYSYTLNPDIPMTNWPQSMADTDPYYGSAYLFFQYFYERFGENAVHQLVKEQANGMDGVDHTLQDLNLVDPGRGHVITANEVFADWTVANYLQRSDLLDGRYGYHSYTQAPKTENTEQIDNCPTDLLSRTVNQYGVDYIAITCRGNLSIQFHGNDIVPLLSTDAHSGTHFFWSNRTNDSDAKLTHHFDFRQTSGPISMSFWTWYDLEDKFDYVYMSVTEDGSNWQVLAPENCEESDDRFGCGFTGKSDGWVQENLDLSQFAGKEIDLRFDYITDTGGLNEGFLLDDVSIPAISYSTDFESGNGGWNPEGFARIENVLPQTYQLTLITQGSTFSVDEITVDANGDATIPVNITNDIDSAVLVVSATTRVTQLEANYSIQIGSQ